LFDNGHATTVVETQATALLINVIKNAGLIGLLTDSNADLAELIFDTDKQTLDEIYTLLKEQKIIY
jgi:bifunctional enzyme CysN/CysC